MSLQERKHPQIEELPLGIEGSELEAFSSMKEKLLAQSDYPCDDIRDAVFLRFLRFHSFNVDTAVEKFIAYLKWRKDNNVDDILSRPMPSGDLIKQLLPFAYHGFDNDGRPVYIEKTGKLDTVGASNPNVVSVGEFDQSHVYGMEYLAQRMQESSLKTGKRIDDFATVLDMDGVGFHHRAVLHILTNAMQMDHAYFPNRIGKIYVINLPWVAPYIYNLVQFALDPVTKSRIHAVQGDPKEFLPTVIPREHLPQEYGGNCSSCNGPCVPVNEEKTAAAVSDAGLDVQSVDYDFERTLECSAAGTTFNWYFLTENEYDIDFSVEIQKVGADGQVIAAADGKKVYAKIPSRCVTSKGSYVSDGPCKLLFRWDNNFSYFTSKTIKYLINQVTLTDADKQLEQSLKA